MVRTFDREVGADNRNIIKGTRAIEAKLKEAPIVARPARVMANALEVSPVRQVRGAMPNPKAAQVGYRPGRPSAKKSMEFCITLARTLSSPRRVVASSWSDHDQLRRRPSAPQMQRACTRQ